MRCLPRGCLPGGCLPRGLSSREGVHLPPVNKITDRCENIRQLLLRTVISPFNISHCIHNAKSLTHTLTLIIQVSGPLHGSHF